MSSSAVELYGLALEGEASPVRVRRADGRAVPLAVDRWLGPLTAADETVLARVKPPALDVGCGPGRHVLALARRGHLALGVDVAPAAVRIARRRGAPVLEASVFERIPGAGRWGSALLLDGNVGIAGAPEALLRRLRELLRPGGEVLVELEPPGVPVSTDRVRLETAAQHSPWFDWGRVGADAIDGIADAAGYGVAERWESERRWFARLVGAAH